MDDEDGDVGRVLSSSQLPLPPPPPPPSFSISHTTILMERQHLQDISQAKSILTNCTPTQGPFSLQNTGAKARTRVFQRPPAPSNLGYTPFFSSLTCPPFPSLYPSVDQGVKVISRGLCGAPIYLLHLVNFSRLG